MTKVIKIQIQQLCFSKTVFFNILAVAAADYGIV